MNKIWGLLLLALGFSFTAFMWLSRKPSLEASKYVGWVRAAENGLHKNRTVAGINLDVQYKPLDYIISNEERSNNIPKDVYQKRKQELDSMQYFDLKLSVQGQGDINITNYRVTNQMEQQQRLYYLSFLMQNDIYVVENSDTLRCKLYHFERSYDMAKHRTFVLGFETKDPLADKIFVFDSQMFSTGPVKMRFKEEDLRNVPYLLVEH